MGSMYEEPAEADPNYTTEPFVKTDREIKIRKLIEAHEMAKTPDEKKKAQNALLQHIEGDEYFSTTEDVKIILFNGPPRSGKDTVADFAMNYLGKRGAKYRFAEPLKNGVHSLFGFGDVSTEYFNETKDKPSEIFKGTTLAGKEISTPRQAYIFMSEEVLKPVFGTDFSARVAVRNIKKICKPVVVISDCGFEIEAQKLIDAFGIDNVKLIHLFREGRTFDNDSRSYITNVDCSIQTLENNGSVHDLYQAIADIIDKFAP